MTGEQRPQPGHRCAGVGRADRPIGIAMIVLALVGGGGLGSYGVLVGAFFLRWRDAPALDRAAQARRPGAEPVNLPRPHIDERYVFSRLGGIAWAGWPRPPT